MGPAERADVLVDFTNAPVGTEITLLNLGPNEPFGGGVPGVDFDPAGPSTTGQAMQFRVVPATEVDSSTPPSQLVLPVITPLGAVNNARQVSLNEEDSAVLEDVGPKAALLGTVNSDGTRNHLLWMDDMTENPNVGATEVWEFHNFTADALPIHIQLVQFEVG